MALPAYFQIVRSGGFEVVTPGKLIGRGHLTGTTPSNEVVDLLYRNPTWLWSKLAQRRLLAWAFWNPLNETRPTSLAPATPGATGAGHLRLSAYVYLAEGRDGANTNLQVDVDHEGGTVVVEVSDTGETAWVGASDTVAAGARTTNTLALSTPGATLGSRNVLIKVYCSHDGGGNHYVYGVRVKEVEIPEVDL